MTSLNHKPCHFVTIYWNISSVDSKETSRRGLLYVQMKLMYFLAKWLLLSSGFTVKVCLYDDDGRMTGSTENRTLYTDEDLHEFLSRRGWSGLREVGSFRDFNSLEDLRRRAPPVSTWSPTNFVFHEGKSASWKLKQVYLLNLGLWLVKQRSEYIHICTL
jgi:hypothetical protein